MTDKSFIPPEPVRQIRALLTGTVVELASKTFGKPLYDSKNTVTHDEIRKTFTVSRADVEAHVNEHGIPEDSCGHEPSTGDGFYVLSEANKIVCFEQERGGRYNEHEFPNWEEAKSFLIDYLLNRNNPKWFIQERFMGK